jgi:large subunit ribosomal protein L9
MQDNQRNLEKGLEKMKVLLLKDVYKLGRAGDVKKVAAGYGRNYLIPQGLAVLATPGALKNAEYIREKAAMQRDALNREMSSVAEKMDGLMLSFSAKASETDKLYGSVTTHMIAEALTEQVGVEIVRRQIDSQPLRNIGLHKVPVRLTVDLVPEISVVVYREGESPETVLEELESEAAVAAVDAEAEGAEGSVEAEAEFLETEAEMTTEVGEDVIVEAVLEQEETEENEMETSETQD